MNPKNSRNTLFLAVLAGSAIYAAPAYAYLDPGTGSMILQILLGGIAGALMVVKLYWYKIKNLFSRGATEMSAADGDQAGKQGHK